MRSRMASAKVGSPMSLSAEHKPAKSVQVLSIEKPVHIDGLTFRAWTRVYWAKCGHDRLLQITFKPRHVQFPFLVPICSNRAPRHFLRCRTAEHLRRGVAD